MMFQPNNRHPCLIALCVLSCVSYVTSLQCYVCGAQGDGMSTVNPCFSISDEDLHTCDGHCKRYDNKGVIVLDCEKNCVQTQTQNTKITCCSTDACNDAAILRKNSVLLVLQIIVSVISALFFRQ